MKYWPNHVFAFLLSECQACCDILQWKATNGSDQIPETSGQNINI